MTFGTQVDLAAAAAMLEACLAAGVTAIDTANVYGGGAAERIVGQLIKGRRDTVSVATKVGLPTDEAGGDAPLSAAAMGRCVEASLRRLGTDHVDLYYLHAPDRRTPIQETLAAVDALVRAGKVVQIGVSNYAAWQLADIDACATAHGLARPAAAQILYNLLSRRVEQEYNEFAATHRLPSIAYNPLAGGLLTGKHPGAGPGAAGRFGSAALGAQYRDRYWHDSLFTAVAALGDIARSAGLTLVELAYRWLRSRPQVDAVVIGASSLSQLEANLAAAAGPDLSPDVAAGCDEIWARLNGPAPAYNR
jgi:aryl-alcohol dehydrogenase-like predicted oxidoreductase